MSTGGESAKLVEEPDETSAFPKSSPKNGVPGGEAMLEAEDLIEFIDPLPKDFECSLCLQYLKQPTLTNCGHHFCKQCIDRAVERSRKLKQGPVCPLCKEKDFQMFIDKKPLRGKYLPCACTASRNLRGVGGRVSWAASTTTWI